MTALPWERPRYQLLRSIRHEIDGCTDVIEACLELFDENPFRPREEQSIAWAKGNHTYIAIKRFDSAWKPLGEQLLFYPEQTAFQKDWERLKQASVPVLELGWTHRIENGFAAFDRDGRRIEILTAGRF